MSSTTMFVKAADHVAGASGRPGVFAAALLTVIAWALAGPLVGYSDSWQLVMNTWTNVVTFLMVFLIQNTQTRDSTALQIKLDELIRVGTARNALIGIERLTEADLEDIRARIEARANATDRA